MRCGRAQDLKTETGPGPGPGLVGVATGLAGGWRAGALRENSPSAAESSWLASAWRDRCGVWLAPAGSIWEVPHIEANRPAPLLEYFSRRPKRIF